MASSHMTCQAALRASSNNTLSSLPARHASFLLTNTIKSAAITRTDKGVCTTPEESFSIEDLLRQNNRERLHLRPLHWTSRHVVLLELAFERRRRTKPVPTAAASSHFPNSSGVRRANYRQHSSPRHPLYTRSSSCTNIEASLPLHGPNSLYSSPATGPVGSSVPAKSRHHRISPHIAEVGGRDAVGLACCLTHG